MRKYMRNYIHTSFPCGVKIQKYRSRLADIYQE